MFAADMLLLSAEGFRENKNSTRNGTEADVDSLEQSGI